MTLYKQLVKKFKRAGISERYLTAYLMPYWWDKSLEKNDGSVMMAIMYLSDLLSLPMEVILNPKIKLRKHLIKCLKNSSVKLK